jgi:hypothetical protein
LSSLAGTSDGFVTFYSDSITSIPYSVTYLTFTNNSKVYAQAVSSYGCKSVGRIAIPITVVDSIELDARDTITICLGGSIDLTTFVKEVNVSNYTLKFYGMDGLPIDQTVSPVTATHYLIEVELDGCKSSRKEVVVDVVVSSSAIDLIGLSDLCNGDTLRLKVSTTGVITSGFWSLPLGTLHLVDSSSTSLTVVADSLLSGNYQITYHYQMGDCEGSLNSTDYNGGVDFQVHPLPVLNVTPAEVCYGG